MIVDDSSNEFLVEDLVLSRCTVVYDRENKGSGELLPYYYFHKLKPFDTAVVIHDSVFLQERVEFDLKDDEGCRFLWNFSHAFNYDVADDVRAMCAAFPQNEELMGLWSRTEDWQGGCFGVMSVVRWSLLDAVDAEYHFFSRLLPLVKCRPDRCALERVFALVLSHRDPNFPPSFFGKIHDNMNMLTTFEAYFAGNFCSQPILKVFTGR
jgi:hypothetical protein